MRVKTKPLQAWAARGMWMLLALAGLGLQPARAEMDLSGTWVIAYHEDWLERGTGPDIGEYQGLPINEAARQRALAWHPSLVNQPERQCLPLPLDYGVLWSNFRIWKEVDERTQKLVAYHFHREWQASERTIWMDGRPHPPADALYSYQGFSTGEWEGETLKVTTTHLKEGYSRRNGVPRSDRSTIVEHYIRHGNYLTISRIVQDPVYLTEPLIHTADYTLSLTKKIQPYPCEIVTEIASFTPGFVPMYFPWKNPFLGEHAKKYNLTMETSMGAAVQMYPQFAEGKDAKPATPVKASGGASGSADAKKAAAAKASAAKSKGGAPDFKDVEVRVIPVRGDIYMLEGAGGNSTVQVGPDGVVIVDTMYAPLSEKILAAIKTLTKEPIRYIINTHFHPDHIGGNAPLAKAGSTINGGNVNAAITDSTAGAAVISHENVNAVISAMPEPPPFEGWPTSTYFTPTKDLFLNGEAVQLIHQPAAHTDGDSFVFFRRNDVIATGDIFTTTMYPFIDAAHGGTFQGIIDALNRLLDLAVPEKTQEGGTLIIPGHGRLSDESDVVEYRDMLTIIRNSIAEMIKEGRSLEDVQKARPTAGYDVRYGADTGFWTTKQFVEAVYRELSAKAAPKK